MARPPRGLTSGKACVTKPGGWRNSPAQPQRSRQARRSGALRKGAGRMSQYILRRMLLSIPALLGVTVVIFVALRVMPGDPVSVMFGTQATKIRPEDRAKIEADLGLSYPLVVQYGKWLKDIGTGKLGKSFWRGDTVVDLIIQRGPLTVEIAIMAIILSWVVGIPVGILSALRQNTLPDYIARLFTILFLAIPSFWLGAMIMLVLLLWWDYAPPLGIINIWDDPTKNLQIVLGPAIVLGLAVSAYIARMARSSLLEIIREDYIRTARAKASESRLSYSGMPSETSRYRLSHSLASSLGTCSVARSLSSRPLMSQVWVKRWPRPL